MTAGSISRGSSAAYAEYLDAKAMAPERGDYYLGRDGLPAEAPGRWHAPVAALTALGVDPAAPVQREALEALMEGRAPSSTREQPVWLRRAGADGTRAAGLDVTFSAPKSVSIAWALSCAGQREGLEAAHRGAVAEALEYLQATVPTVAVYRGGGLPPREVPAAGLLAAEFVHTTARGVEDGVPDPHLHSHCVITSVLRADGSVDRRHVVCGRRARKLQVGLFETAGMRRWTFGARGPPSARTSTSASRARGRRRPVVARPPRCERHTAALASGR